MVIGMDGQVRRRCSGRLRIPGRSEPNHAELFASLRQQIGEKAIVAIQPFGMGRFELLFESEMELNKAVERGLFFSGVKHDIEPVDSEVRWLYIKYAPFELENKDLEICLAPYGQIKSMEFVYPEEMRPWHNGERKVKFVMKKAVPNFLKVGVYTVHIHYAGVVKLCRKCHSNAHMARECNNNNCRRCGKPGHVEVDCGEEGEDTESPSSIMKLAEKARDKLLSNLRASREDLAKRALTLENPEEDDDEEQEDESETDDTQDHEDQSESMPELEESEESEKEDTVRGNDEESTGDEQDLERNQYLKDKGENKKEDSREIESNRSSKKKLSKQERKKKRLIEEKERNKKREREESKSPGTEVPVTQEGSKGETEKLEKRKEEEEFMIVHFDLPDMTYGDLKERTSRMFQVGVIRSIKKTEQGMWAIEFNDERWANQVIRTGLIDDDMTFYPVLTTLGNRSREIQYSPEKVMSMAEEKKLKI